ncbi:MAG: HAAS signaling domain-containing protein [Acidimicrobiales bacterium]
MKDEDQIERYLDDLLVHLRGSPRAVRRVLAEAEAHLHDAVADGATPAEAVARFGEVREVAARASTQAGVPASVLARQFILVAGLLCSLGFIAIWLSGALAGVMDAAYGPRFVAGDLPSITYTPERCAEYRELAPADPTCLAAAARHHTNEIETTRVAAGVVGLAGLGAWFVLRRLWRTTPVSGALPPAAVTAVGTALFGVAALALAAEAVQAIGWRSTAGLGQWLSASVVSAAFATGFAIALLRQLRRPAPALG